MVRDNVHGVRVTGRLLVKDGDSDRLFETVGAGVSVDDGVTDMVKSLLGLLVTEGDRENDVDGESLTESVGVSENVGVRDKL